MRQVHRFGINHFQNRNKCRRTGWCRLPFSSGACLFTLDANPLAKLVGVHTSLQCQPGNGGPRLLARFDQLALAITVVPVLAVGRFTDHPQWQEVKVSL